MQIYVESATFTEKKGKVGGKAKARLVPEPDTFLDWQEALSLLGERVSVDGFAVELSRCVVDAEGLRLTFTAGGRLGRRLRELLEDQEVAVFRLELHLTGLEICKSWVGRQLLFQGSQLSLPFQKPEKA